ncbi:hypothetical protein COR50_14985 [Chitinophaga caeni]|uniref:Gfo/Idh/MocA-like oxidoreductase N-terminal domain-containing protein n=1 Tax=Chitinophaga caeni TaxID=2029983 RepID=A0A291QWQ3_9BACT|nr:Gfo/Idh/MocA family oxidoreductase [Chitinophaga caeni]ATL48360.1 hypothetical protein COR50_14985 [Chitinophaga caeni]
MDRSHRRTFLRQAAIIGAGFTLLPTTVTKSKEKLRVGIIGLGQEGLLHFNNASLHPGIEITALCDLNPATLNDAVTVLKKNSARTYAGSTDAYLQLLQQQNVDAVIIASPKEFHFRMIMEAWKAGKQVAVAGILAGSVDEHLKLLHASEKYNKQLFILNRGWSIGKNLHEQRTLPAKIGRVTSAKIGAHLDYIDTYHAAYPSASLLDIARLMGISGDNHFSNMEIYSPGRYEVLRLQVDKKGILRTKIDAEKVTMAKLTTATGQEIQVQLNNSDKNPFTVGTVIRGEDGFWMKDLKQLVLHEGWVQQDYQLTHTDIRKNDKATDWAMYSALDDFYRLAFSGKTDLAMNRLLINCSLVETHLHHCKEEYGLKVALPNTFLA